VQDSADEIKRLRDEHARLRTLLQAPVGERFWALEQDICAIEDRLANLGDAEFAQPR
jgi:hypothetical protein